jgi:hypothetical protein
MAKIIDFKGSREDARDEESRAFQCSQALLELVGGEIQ